MKAVMKVAPGVGNIEVRDIPEPVPGPGQVKIEIRAAGICGTDLHIYKDEYSSRPPVVLGHEVAGVLVETGSEVTGIRIGARVTSETFYYTCGACLLCRRGLINLCPHRLSIGSGVNGGFTKYLIVPAKNVHELPENVDFEGGALSEPLACVVNGVFRTTTVSPGDLAVIAGPGAVGLLAIQVVKAAGARTVLLGASGDEKRLELGRSLGADYVVNVQEEDPRRLVADLSTEGMGADVVYECSGAPRAALDLLNLVPARNVVVQARADHAGENPPDGDLEDQIPVTSPPDIAHSQQPDGGGDRGEQHQPVEMDGQGPEANRALPGRRNRGE